MFVDFNKVIHRQSEEIENIYNEIIAKARKNKYCTVCEHKRSIEDYELCHKTSIFICKITGKPVGGNTTCNNFELGRMYETLH